MSEEPDLVRLLYRADWTRLRLAAEVTTSRDFDLDRNRYGADEFGPPRHRRIAGPGPRRRAARGFRNRAETIICDGERQWTIVADEVDAELGILLRSVCHAGSRPVSRYELRDLVLGEQGDFRVDVGEGARVEEEPDDEPAGPASIPAQVAASSPGRRPGTRDQRSGVCSAACGAQPGGQRRTMLAILPGTMTSRATSSRG